MSPGERWPAVRVIADDLTGATDVAAALSLTGRRTVVAVGSAPDGLADVATEADAIVVALKTRTAPVDLAVDETLRALHWLDQHTGGPLILKICSTFDSTDTGNIGPVGDALLDELGTDLAVVCPASPANRRTVYLGHLFVGDRLLQDSSMADHPLTPMRDSRLVQLLERQSKHACGLVPLQDVHRGVEAVRETLAALRRAGVRYAVVDAVDDADLAIVARASEDIGLWLAASGLPGAMAGPAVSTRLAPWPDERGPVAVIAGSTSTATREQVERLAAMTPSVRVDAERAFDDGAYVGSVIDEALRKLRAAGAVLVYSSAPPEVVAAAQCLAEPGRVAATVEQVLARAGAALVKEGVRRLVVAGGETSGAVVSALGVQGMSVCATIAAGVPWMRTLDGSGLWLALKSGNFGGPSFFLDALREPA
jgi:uncharacterized protein YgbK (DUF1537 family)